MSNAEEDKDHKVFEEYWKRKRITAKGYFGFENAIEMSRLIALDSFNQGIEYEQNKKELKRDPIWQPKPGDILGVCGMFLKVISIVENEQNIMINTLRMNSEDINKVELKGFSNGSQGPEAYNVTLQGWQTWAKNSDFVRRRSRRK